MVAKRVAVIGLGPAGAITIDALAQEKAFDAIRVFERREAAGGCWSDEVPPPNLDPSTFLALTSRSGDMPVRIPPVLPVKTPKLPQPRYAESSVYPYLETNADSAPMSFSQETIPEGRSQLSISRHGRDTPFRHHSIVRKYIESLVNRDGYEKMVSYNTTVELAEKVDSKWRLVLRKDSNVGAEDQWWEEWFDAVCVASGHYSVPYIPKIDGLEEFARSRLGRVKHSKMFRGPDSYRGKRAIVVGAAVSSADIAYDLIGVAKSPVYAVSIGHKPNWYFGDSAFEHPGIASKPCISHITTTNHKQTVYFIDGTFVHGVDEIIFGTGYSWSLPFLPHIEVRNNRVPDLYQHVVYQKDPSLLFIGAVAPGLTFRVFEWQAVLAARILAGRTTLPPLEEQQRWETDRIAKRGDGVSFTLIFPDFEDYFEALRKLAGEPQTGDPGRRLPVFDNSWITTFMAGHERRKKWWREENERARQKEAEVPGARL
ncbi:hypothetical protein GQ44DRAFT_637926 [Phaeosphaeriaceae sp. PMI808]|nr:hypothetical protein GQ44DRAFT_637926 [Phaeosphaeriaceae sp. PMI808]